MKKHLLLRALSDGEFHSGQDLAESLGVSRTAIWGQLKKFSASGYDIHSVQGRGYRIYGGVELLDSRRIASYLQVPDVPLPEIVDSVDSTNSYLLNKINAQLISGTAIIAEEQTHGRGRQGRKWISPFATNLYLSFFWLFSNSFDQLSGLSLAVAAVVARALRQYGILGISLKWPNDVFYQGKKLAGILIESRPLEQQIGVVMGIGLNVNMRQQDIAAIDQPCIDVKTIRGKMSSRNMLAGLLLNELCLAMPIFEAQGFANFHDEWRELDMFQGHEIELEFNQQKSYGRVLGVDDDGNLLVKTAATINKYHSGGVKIRLL